MQRFMKFLIGGLVLIVFTMTFGWLLFPMMLRMQMHKKVALKPGGEVRGMWSKFPFALEFRIYLYNITNPDEIKQGGKPIVEQIGPYYFEEWQEKVGIVDHEEDDTVEFSVKNKWIFKPELSGKGLTGNEELVLPHLFILAMVMGADKENPKMMPMLNKAVNSLFKSPDNVFMKIRAMDYLFDGLIIDCNVEDFAATAVCSMLADADGLLKDGENRYKFSVFGMKNDTASKGVLRVLRGVKNLKDVGVVVEYNHKKNISIWNDDYCDTFNGTDGTIFHPMLYEDEDIVSFAPDLCRSLSLRFSHKVKVAGLKVNRYTISFGDSNTIPEQKCFCDGPNDCPKKGVIDLYKCSGVPLTATHPHFYESDESLIKMVGGQHPSQEKHQSFLNFDGFTATPLEAKKRLQFNIMIHKIEKFKIMKNFPEAMLPLLWVEEALILPDDMVKQIKTGHRVVFVVAWIKWLLITAGVAMLGTAAYMNFRRFKETQVIMTKTNKSNPASGTVEGKSSAKDLKPVESPAVPPNIE